MRHDLTDLKHFFRTPIFDFEDVATQKELPRLNGKQQTWFCGSHFGYGLHEDAVTSAIEVARLKMEQAHRLPMKMSITSNTGGTK